MSQLGLVYQIVHLPSGKSYKRYVRQNCDIGFCNRKAVAACYYCMNKLCQKHNSHKQVDGSSLCFGLL
jgi:hypothetical protein